MPKVMLVVYTTLTIGAIYMSTNDPFTGQNELKREQSVRSGVGYIGGGYSQGK